MESFIKRFKKASFYCKFFSFAIGAGVQKPVIDPVVKVPILVGGHDILLIAKDIINSWSQPILIIAN